MPWHSFIPGDVYTVYEIVEKLRQRLASGHVKDVPAKQIEVDLIEHHGPADLVWTPTKSWKRSPFNCNAWRRTDGSEFVSEDAQKAFRTARRAQLA